MRSDSYIPSIRLDPVCRPCQPRSRVCKYRNLRLSDTSDDECFVLEYLQIWNEFTDVERLFAQRRRRFYEGDANSKLDGHYQGDDTVLPGAKVFYRGQK